MAEPPGTADRSPRILYADDDASSRLLVQKILASFSCQLDLCENGSSAVDAYRTGTYDLVLMDLQMPVMDGSSACRAIRDWEHEHGAAETPIIALTAAETEEEIQTFRDAGCTAHLRKPLSRQALLASFNRYIPDSSQFSQGKQPVEVHVTRDLEDLIPGYLESRKRDVVVLRRAAAAGEFETIRTVAHPLKGSGGGYGFSGITEIAGHLEAGAANKNVEECRRRIEELAEYLERVRVTYS